MRDRLRHANRRAVENPTGQGSGVRVGKGVADVIPVPGCFLCVCLLCARHVDLIPALA